ncbi:MAG TPA: ATP-binding protein [Mucilaginibacter sp.]
MKTLSRFFFCGLLFFTVTNARAQHTIKQIWATDTVVVIPESVLPVKDIMYVSEIDGAPWGRDGKGEVGKLTRDGKVIDLNWITGLNAPKGLAINGDLLYVADLDELVVISISQNKIDHKIKIPGAEGLNDVTVDKNGVVYVSDTQKACVFRVEKDAATLYLDNIKGANGLKAIGDKLYVLSGDGMYVTGPDKKLTKICVLENGGDGIEPIGNGDFLVTAWGGWLYYVHADGTRDLLLDTHTTKKRTADIGYDPKARIIYVPTFLGKSVDAYKLD